MPKPRILIVEDDPPIRNLISAAAELQHYAVQTAATGSEGLMAALSSPPDVLLLDLGLPDMDGLDIIVKIRGWSELPIIVISARSDDSDKVAALDAGADDYLLKPFSVDELLARLRVALRRVRKTEGGGQSVYRNGPLSIDFTAGTATLDGAELRLTPIEYRLLCLLARNTGKVLTHNAILREVWGVGHTAHLPSMRVFMATLRRKLEPDHPAEPRFIQTHVGIGYRMLRME